MSSLDTANIGRIERGPVAMGCVLDVVRELLAGIKRGHPERSRGIPILGLTADGLTKSFRALRSPPYDVPLF